MCINVKSHQSDGFAIFLKTVRYLLDVTHFSTFSQKSKSL